MCVHYGVCAPQSALFALATTHSPNVLLNASRLFRSPSALRLRGPTELLRRGQLDAIGAKRNNRYSVATLITARA